MLKFILNNSDVSTDVANGTTLLDFIRSNRHLKGTKSGCREGDCGACTVLIGELKNGEMEYQNATSCITPLGNLAGKHVVTIEGVNVQNVGNTEGVLTPVQQAMNDEAATQCGFCTVGFVMSMTGFFLSSDAPNKDNMIAAIDGNICRCTGYKSIERAADRVVDLLKNNANSLENHQNLTFSIEKNIVPPYFSTIKNRLETLKNNEEKSLQNGSQNGSQNSNKDGLTKQYFVGGGTDLYVQKHAEMVYAPAKRLFNDQILRGIKRVGEWVEMGASATVSDMKNSELMNQIFPNLQAHLKLVSSTPIRNIATIAGNFVNASPIGDMTVFFLALDTVLVLNNGGIRREIALKNFYKGYKTLDKTADEFVETIKFKIPETTAFFNFEKVCKRTYLDIASVNTAILFTAKNGRFEKANIAAGGVAPIPFFLQKTSNFLIGKPISASTILAAIEIMQTEIAPISDVRGTSKYKRFLLGQLLKAHFLF